MTAADFGARHDAPVWHPGPDLLTTLTETCPVRLTLVSPPRTASTSVARMLWQHQALTHHCHEPFEACYWGGPPSSVRQNLSRPMEVTTGRHLPLAELPTGSGLLLKEMTFQLDTEQFRLLAGLATAPVVFVLRDPAAATVSRLRIVRELYDAETFPPFESGWDALADQVELCRREGLAYVLVDADELRAAPEATARALLAALGLPAQDGVHTWAPRPGLRLVTPEVGALMSQARTRDDPFYRRVLASDGIKAVDPVDHTAQRRAIAAAGLDEHVARWREIHARLRTDPRLVRAVPAP